MGEGESAGGVILAALTPSSLRARRLHLLDQLFGYLWGGAIAVEGRDFAARDEFITLAVRDGIGEIEGEERAVETDHQIGCLVAFDYGDV